jgi:catechol-2,3-dioxygenase
VLSNIDAQPKLVVRNLNRARSFYETVLGLRPIGPAMPTVQCYLAGRTVLVVYESEFAGTNKATADPDMDKPDLIREAMKVLVRVQAAKRLAALGGGAAAMKCIPRRPPTIDRRR